MLANKIFYPIMQGYSKAFVVGREKLLIGSAVSRTYRLLITQRYKHKSSSLTSSGKGESGYCIPTLEGKGGRGGRVVTLSPPTSEAGVRSPSRPYVGKLVVACRSSAVYSTEP